MKINWKVRFKNKMFWVLIIPALLVLVSQIAEVFGFKLDLTTLESQLKNIIDTIFLILGALGIVIDPTTAGVGDSENALTYDTPNK